MRGCPNIVGSPSIYGTFSGMGGQFAATNAQEEALLRYGRRLLRLSKVAGIRIDHISQDVAESIVLERL